MSHPLERRAAAFGFSAALVSSVGQSFFIGLFGAFVTARLGGQGLAGHMAIVAAARHARNRGRSIATAAFGFILGEALLPLAVVALLGWLDWRWVWGCASLLVLGVALPALRVAAAPLPKAAVLMEGEGVPPLRRRQLLVKPAFAAALSVVLVSPFVVTAIFLHQATLSELRGWAPAQIAWGFFGFAAAQTASTWLTGRWIDRHGARSVFRVYLLPVAVAVLMFAFGPPQWALWALFMGLGATAGANSVVSGALWAEVFGIDNLGMVRGIYTGFMVIATAVSPLLFGLALEQGVSMALLAAGVCAYVVAVPWLAAGRLPGKS